MYSFLFQSAMHNIYIYIYIYYFKIFILTPENDTNIAKHLCVIIIYRYNKTIYRIIILPVFFCVKLGRSHCRRKES